MNDIGWAVAQLRAGIHIRRRAWEGKHMTLCLTPTGSVKALVRRPTDAVVSTVSWLCAHPDLLACDWEVAP